MSLVFALTSCVDHDGSDADNPVIDPTTAEESCILIYSSAADLALKQKVADFALSEFNKAQQNLNHKVKFTFRFVDVDEQNFDGAASNYLLSGKYSCIVGPDDNTPDKAVSLLNTANNCFRDNAKAPGIIIPSLTSTDGIRLANDMPFVRILTPAGGNMLYDAMKTMSLLTYSPYIFLLYSDEENGATYSRFFESYAAEFGYSWVGQANETAEANGYVKVKANISRDDLEKKIMNKYHEFCDQLQLKGDSVRFFNFVVTTSNPEHGLLIDSLRNEMSKENPAFRDTDITLLSRQNALDHVDKYHDAISISLSAAPTNTDFANEFKKRFGKYPVQGEAHFYDAVLMSLYTEYTRLYQAKVHEAGEEVWSGNAALAAILGGKEDVGTSWNSEGIQKFLTRCQNQDIVKLRGASSEWNFIELDNFTSAHNGYYSLNYMYKPETQKKDKTVPDVWASTETTVNEWYGNISDTEDTWEPEAADIETAVVDLDRNISKDVQNRWALLVAGTKATENGVWGENYRHQADVWNVYHMLRNHGYEKNHIIVVTEDDIFKVQLYPEYGDQKVVKRGPGESDENLHETIPSHYQLSNITQNDLIDIISGNKSERLPYVIESTDHDNVFIYWSGHGNSKGQLRWDGKDSEAGGEYSQKFTPDHMHNALNRMREYTSISNDESIVSGYKYRRLMMVVEACHSGKFITSLPQCKGMFFMSAAEGEESSWADNSNLIQIDFNGKSQIIHRFDYFTAQFVKLVEAEPTITLSKLFERLYNSVTESHPQIYNVVNYGSLQHLSFTDFRTQ